MPALATLLGKALTFARLQLAGKMIISPRLRLMQIIFIGALIFTSLAKLTIFRLLCLETFDHQNFNKTDYKHSITSKITYSILQFENIVHFLTIFLSLKTSILIKERIEYS